MPTVIKKIFSKNNTNHGGVFTEEVLIFSEKLVESTHYFHCVSCDNGCIIPANPMDVGVEIHLQKFALQLITFLKLVHFFETQQLFFIKQKTFSLIPSNVFSLFGSFSLSFSYFLFVKYQVDLEQSNSYGAFVSRN